jgi:hypothetical protein
MNHQDVLNACYENETRVDALHYLAAESYGNNYKLIDSMSDEYTAIANALGIDPLVPTDVAGDELIEYITESLGFLGFLVKMSTPVPKYVPKYYSVVGRKVSPYAFSWSHYTSTWVYADSLSEALKLGFEWQKQYMEDMKAKAAAGIK